MIKYNSESLFYRSRKRNDIYVCEDLFTDENDFLWKTIEKDRTLHCQRQTADKIHSQTTKIVIVNIVTEFSFEYWSKSNY